MQKGRQGVKAVLRWLLKNECYYLCLNRKKENHEVNRIHTLVYLLAYYGVVRSYINFLRDTSMENDVWSYDIKIYKSLAGYRQKEWRNEGRKERKGKKGG